MTMASFLKSFKSDKGYPPSYQTPYNPIGTSTVPPPAAQTFPTSFACVAVSLRDRINFINIPPYDVQEVERAIAVLWPRGIQNAWQNGPSYEIQFSGNPWTHYPYVTAELIDARVLFCGLLQALFERGWMLKGSADIFQKEKDSGQCPIASCP